MAVPERVLEQVITVALSDGDIADARRTVGEVDCGVLLQARRGAMHAPMEVRYRVEAILDELVWTSVGI